MLDQLLEIAIGLSYTFLVLSLLCSALREALASALQTRAKILLDGVLELLQEGSYKKRGYSRLLAPLRQLFRGRDAFGLNALPPHALTRGVLSQPLIRALMQEGRLPSYIPSTVFARALVCTLMDRCPQASANAARGSALIGSIAGTPLAKALKSMVGEAQVDLATLEQSVQQQYELTMERVSGWYKRRSQMVLFLIGLVLAASMNIDTIALARRLWERPAEAKGMIDRINLAAFQKQVDAQRPAGPSAEAPSNASVQANIDALKKLPIGWNQDTMRCTKEGCAEVVALGLAGWLITAFAASLGAPFWFDGLGGLLALRGSVNPEGKAGKDEPKAPPLLPAFSQKPPPPPPPTRFESEGLSTDDVLELQRRLGLTGQALSGRLDQVTRDQVKAMQLVNREPPSGVLTPELVRKILNI